MAREDLPYDPDRDAGLEALGQRKRRGLLSPEMLAAMEHTLAAPGIMGKDLSTAMDASIGAPMRAGMKEFADTSDIKSAGRKALAQFWTDPKTAPTSEDVMESYSLPRNTGVALDSITPSPMDFLPGGGGIMAAGVIPFIKKGMQKAEEGAVEKGLLSAGEHAAEKEAPGELVDMAEALKRRALPKEEERAIEKTGLNEAKIPEPEAPLAQKLDFPSEKATKPGVNPAILDEELPQPTGMNEFINKKNRAEKIAEDAPWREKYLDSVRNEKIPPPNNVKPLRETFAKDLAEDYVPKNYSEHVDQVTDKIRARYGDNQPENLGKIGSQKSTYAFGDVHNSILQPETSAKYSQKSGHWNAPMPFPDKFDPVKANGVLGADLLEGGSDPFMWMDKKYGLTKQALDEFGPQIKKINTRSDLVAQDDYINRIAKTGAEVNIIIPTMDEHMAAMVEPGAPSIKRRLLAFTKLKENGIPAKLTVMQQPELGHIEEFNPQASLEAARSAVPPMYKRFVTTEQAPPLSKDSMKEFERATGVMLPSRKKR